MPVSEEELRQLVVCLPPESTKRLRRFARVLRDKLEQEKEQPKEAKETV